MLPSDTSVGSAGSTSASRQTWVTGGAVSSRAGAILERLRPAGPLGDEPIEETAVYRHRADARRSTPRPARATRSWRSASPPTAPSCDVDVELGLVRAVEVATTQDVGRVMNPLALEGQIQGGSPRAWAWR